MFFRFDKFYHTLLGLLFFFLLIPSFVFAQENVIKDFSVEITVQSDAEILVSERISFDFPSGHEGVILRRLPSHYNARGSVFALGISDIAVSGPAGEPEAFSFRREADHIDLEIGERGAVISGQRSYVITYSARRAINFFADQDELYWPVTGYDWPMDIEQAKAIVSLPAPSDESKTKAECFSGPEESQARCISERFNYAAKNRVESAVFIDDKLPVGQGLAIVLGWQKGIVAKPAFSSKLVEAIRGNVIFGLPVFSLAIAFWLRRGLSRKQKRINRNVYRILGVLALLGAWFLGPLFDWFGVAAIILSGLIILAFSFLPPPLGGQSSESDKA